MSDHGPARIDAYCITGTSPTSRVRENRDTIHLVGPGAVGRAVLNRLVDDRRRLVAVTDSTATLIDEAGIDPREVLQWKEAGRSLRDYSGARAVSAAEALYEVQADLVIDTTSSDLDRVGWTRALSGVLERGGSLALAAKAALSDAAHEWLTGACAARIGCNAVLGGTGNSFSTELPELRRRWRSIAIVGNASSTAIIQAVEQGATLEEGIGRAAQLGYLEPDPEQDLRGTDAAVKLSIVAGALSGRRVDPRIIPCEDIRDIDLLTVRARGRRNFTTRLVARISTDGDPTVAYEQVANDSLLAAPCGRVVYDYRLDQGERRLHVGDGLGADTTAAAVWADVRRLGRRTARQERRSISAGAS